MKILMLTPYLPYPLLSGGQIRTYNLLKQLATKHEITLFALIKSENERQYINHIKPFCKRIKVFKRSKKPFTTKNILKTFFSTFPFLVIRNHVPEIINEVNKELANNTYDLIHSETFYMMPHIPQSNIPILLVEQTIEYLGYQSYAKKHHPLIRKILSIDIKKIVKWENHYWKKADTLITMSADDKKFIQKQLDNPNKVKVVSNGVDTDWFAQKKRNLPTTPTILYVGTFKWLPNIEAVEYLVEKVWPLIIRDLPQAKLKIVGNAPTNKIKRYQQSYENIEVTGKVKDIRETFVTSHLLLAPVFSGKGTRYKILEAMASGTPIVASKIAVEGLNLINQKHALITNDPKQMSKYVIQLISDKNLQKSLSENGKRFVSKHYDWKKISSDLDSIYQSMGNKTNPCQSTN